MSDDASLPPSVRLLAMSAHLSVFTCLPIFLVPMYASDHPFAQAHATWAKQWYLWFLLACVLTGIVTAGTFGAGIFLLALPTIIGAIGAVGFGHAMIGWMPPAWLTARYKTDKERDEERRRRRS